MKNKKGFTLAELLIVVAIIGVLVAISIPVFTGQLERARIAVDQSNVRSAKAAAIAEWMTDGMTAWESNSHFYDASSGTVVTSVPANGYGKYTKNDKEDVIGATGTPNENGTANYLTINIDADGKVLLSWGRGYGSTYKSWATSEFANKNAPLTPETAQQRLNADVDIMKVIGSKYLGMTKDEIISATGLNPAYQGRLKNDEGVGIISYRNQGTTNPQVRGDYSVLSQFGFNGDVGSVASNSYSNSSNRLFFSDYFNSTAEAEVKIGKVQYDDNGKATSITVWVRQIQENSSREVLPNEFKEIVVTN